MRAAHSNLQRQNTVKNEINEESHASYTQRSYVQAPSR